MRLLPCKCARSVEADWGPQVTRGRARSRRVDEEGFESGDSLGTSSVWGVLVVTKEP